MLGINLATVLHSANDWGKEYWGFILILALIVLSLNNVMRNVTHLIRNLRYRRVENYANMSTNHSKERPSLAHVGFGNMRRTPQQIVDGMSDLELAKVISQDRFRRLDDLRPHMRYTS